MARYQDAIKWIVDNDDTEWVSDDSATESVTAALVADLFNKTDEKIRADIKDALRRDREHRTLMRMAAQS